MNFFRRVVQGQPDDRLSTNMQHSLIHTPQTSINNDHTSQTSDHALLGSDSMANYNNNGNPN